MVGRVGNIPTTYIQLTLWLDQHTDILSFQTGSNKQIYNFLQNNTDKAVIGLKTKAYFPYVIIVYI